MRTTLPRGFWPRGSDLLYVYFQNSDELPAVFSEMARERETAVIIWDDPGMAPLVSEVLALTARCRLAMMCEGVAWTQRGALVSYGPRGNDIYREAATYVDRILKGAKPADWRSRTREGGSRSL
jgi:putative ABC transport system substrate-binding protein